MSDAEGRSSSAAPEPGQRRRRRRLSAWRLRLIRWLEGAHEPAPAPPAAPAAEGSPAPEPSEPEVDLVDQAEAFATKRVADVMTPRADIVALEISTPLDEVVRRATAAPARLMGYEGTVGTLKPGANADIAVFELRDGNFELRDSDGGTITARQRLMAQLTVKDGRIWYERAPE